MFRESEYSKDEAGRVKEGWYFFCVTGLNITAKLLTSLSKGLFDATALSLMEQESGDWTLAGAFDHWYCMIWRAFHAKWVGEKKDMMAFNQFFDSLYQSDFIKNHHRYLQEYIDSLAPRKE